MSVQPPNSLTNPVASLPFLDPENQQDLKEQKIFNQNIFTSPTKKQVENPAFKQTVTQLTGLDATLEPTETAKIVSTLKAIILNQKRKRPSSDVLADAQEIPRKERKLEAAQAIKGTSEKENFDSTTTSSVENQNITIENIPSLIKDKSMTEIMEIINEANELLPKNWIDEIKDLPTKALFLIAQHETGNISLAQLYKNLNVLIERSKYTLQLEGNKLVLCMLYVEKQNYDMLKALSKIKALTHVSLDAPFLDSQIEDIVFPYVEKVKVGYVFGMQCACSLNFAQLFPNSSHYTFDMPLEQAKDLLDRIPLTITYLTLFAFKGKNLTPETLTFIEEKFRNLRLFNWISPSNKKAVSIPLPRINTVQAEEPKEP